MRTTTATVTFKAPFLLPGFDAPHAPGSFEVITDEEPLDMSFEAWHRVRTTLMIPNRFGVSAWTVHPLDLERALAVDATRSEPGDGQ